MHVVEDVRPQVSEVGGGDVVPVDVQGHLLPDRVVPLVSGLNDGNAEFAQHCGLALADLVQLDGALPPGGTQIVALFGQQRFLEYARWACGWGRRAR